MKLSVTQVSYRTNGHLLLEGVTFEVASGELTAVIGPNGAGKSTLVRIAAGDVNPTSGSVAYDDVNVGGLSVAHKARVRAVLAHQHSADVPYTVRQVVSMGRYPYRFDPGNEPLADHEAIESAIALLDLDGLRHRTVGTLSGGEQQRVAMARVLAQRTPIVFLDEPTTSLDIRHQESVMALIEALGTQGHTVLGVLHDLNMVSHFNKVILLNEGRVAASGTPREVLTTERLTSVYGHPIDVVEHPTRPGILMVPRAIRS